MQFLDFLKVLRRRYPGERLYVILDNFSPRLRAEVSDWCSTNNVELVFIPTNASELNWIGAEFAALRSSPLTAATAAIPDQGST